MHRHKAVTQAPDWSLALEVWQISGNSAIQSSRFNFELSCLLLSKEYESQLWRFLPTSTNAQGHFDERLIHLLERMPHMSHWRKPSAADGRLARASFWDGEKEMQPFWFLETLRVHACCLGSLSPAPIRVGSAGSPCPAPAGGKWRSRAGTQKHANHTAPGSNSAAQET